MSQGNCKEKAGQLGMAGSNVPFPKGIQMRASVYLQVQCQLARQLFLCNQAALIREFLPLIKSDFLT
jgi:hypothetical protein